MPEKTHDIDGGKPTQNGELAKVQAELKAARRELEIEAGLERVRAATMEMSHVDELTTVITPLFENLNALGIEPITAWIALYDTEKREFDWYQVGRLGVAFADFITLSFDKHPQIASVLNQWLEGTECIVTTFPVEETEKVLGYFEPLFSKQPEEARPSVEDYPNGIVSIQARHKFGVLGYGVSRPVSKEEKQIAIKFAREFERLYQRFLDLQKAQQQTREALIETSLERIRGEALAMTDSRDLLDIMVTMHAEFTGLGFTPGFFWHMRWLPDTYIKASTTIDGSKIESVMELPRHFSGIQDFVDWESSTEPIGVFKLEPDSAVHYVNQMIEKGKLLEVDDDPPTPKMIRDMGGFTFVQARTTHGEIGYFLPGIQDPNQEAKDILVRFAGAFDLAYRRFEDLKLAEAQAREAQVETSLERIRAAAMAMHRSDDFLDVANVVWEQLEELNVAEKQHVMISVNDLDEGTFDGYVMVVSDANDPDSPPERLKHFDRFPVSSTTYTQDVTDRWLSGETYIKTELSGTSLAEFIDELVYEPLKPQYRNSNVETFYHDCATYSNGLISLGSLDPIGSQTEDILSRFAGAFDLAYRRFEDLKLAETRAEEVQKQASVDRIQAEIATMRTTDDFRRITPLVWKELELLDIPFFRCGILLANEDEQIVRFYLSNPEGAALAELKLPYGTSDIADAVLDAWRNYKPFFETWDRDRFQAWTHEMMEIGQIERPEDYYGAVEAPESVSLHFVPFQQGMMYVGSYEPLEAGQVDVLQSLADAFSVAYARYDDFQATEKALKELQSTQRQLIEQEKLASLGSLTAGIAHEIKNPLNFVNNFAEVSAELADELSEAVAAGDTDEVKIILDDLRQNSKQIAKHGKRADSIVRSMMQHARGGTSEKEEIDINEFLDEYVNLAWHGMRARDNSFQAEIVKHFEDVGAVTILPQEIGRVVLNLLNNAFQAVNSPTRQESIPTVTISTVRLNGSVEITVADNGPGIPEEIKDKIFEPFFTTKATGEGTGLGLSLSHDIITKGHGGTIAVESEPGEGASFKITLPV